MIAVKINLLPWRSQQRLARMQRFKNYLAVSILIGAGFAAAAGWYMDSQIEAQSARNNLITQGINQLSGVQKELDDAKEVVRLLTARIESMRALSSQRNDIVMLFTEISTAIPDQIFLSKLDIEGKEIKFVGMSETDNAITSFSERLKISDGISEPVMYERSDVKIGNTSLRRFIMTASRLSLESNSKNAK